MLQPLGWKRSTSRCAARRFACVRLRWVDVCIQRIEQIPKSKSVQVLKECYKSAYQYSSIAVYQHHLISDIYNNT